MYETISNPDVNFLNLHIDKATKTSGDKQLYLITHFTKQTLNLNYLLLTDKQLGNVTSVVEYSKIVTAQQLGDRNMHIIHIFLRFMHISCLKYSS